jgi:hypothetical protein
MEATAARPATTWREIGALILLPFGGVLLPLWGWFGGIALLWLSPRWRVRDKVIGTVVLPGGLFLAFAGLGLLPFTPSASPSPVCPRHAVCATATLQASGQRQPLGGVFAFLIPVVLVGAPLAADAYLFRRLKAR